MKFAALAGLLLTGVIYAADTIPTAQAKEHIGQTATVCGKVASARFLESSNRQPTFLNFDKAYPDHTFTAVIFGDSRAKFGKPEEQYLQKDVCVTGEIKNYNGKPQIELTDPKQVRVDSK
jgi:DNA/RNA endonuclease YhcR with UshA esterase domain